MARQNESGLNGKTSAAMANDYAQRALRGAPALTITEAQVLWNLCTQIRAAAESAEHASLMLMSEITTGQSTGSDFKVGLTNHLTEVAKQMRGVKALLSGGVEGLKQREGEAA